uniref:Ig-like domain-containing protein n=1 Tax=Sander lucioperca TaxID=283035 RepID=A0A8C9ZDE0_SANLU
MMLEGQVSGSTPFTVSFYKNTKLIRNDKRHRITVKDELIALQVLAVEAGDVGLYQCTPLSSLVGSEVSLQCTLKGSEPMTVSWTKDNHELKEAENIQISYENNTLFFAKTSDSGDYVCEIQNDVGSTSCQATLFVKGYHSLCQTESVNMSPSICSYGQFSICCLKADPPLCDGVFNQKLIKNLTVRHFPLAHCFYHQGLESLAKDTRKSKCNVKLKGDLTPIQEGKKRSFSLLFIYGL